MLLLGLVRGGCVGWGKWVWGRGRGRRCGVSFLLASLVGGGGVMMKVGRERGGRRRNEEREKKKEEMMKKKKMKRRMAQITVAKI